MKVKVADLFCGAGLFSAAFKNRKFEHVFAADIEERAVKSYSENLRGVARVADVTKPLASVRCEVLLAGPPCQGFSTLGSRNPLDERNKLSLAVADWAMTAKPKVIVVENVPQFTESKQWRELSKQLARQGFDRDVWILDSADYGAPQNRKRAFSIYSKIGLPSQPAAKARRINVREAFDGLSESNLADPLNVYPVPSKIAESRFERIPPGGDKRDVMRTAPWLCPPSWSRIRGQATDVWGRMVYDEPSNTIRCCFQNASKGRYIHPEKNRVITLREGARLQGIPDSWKFFGDRSSIARQIGNGVPFPLGKAVASAIETLF